ncbi:DUF6677 family protein [uncultured Gimesia sp.]|uniref:DUF6677 family protein n=1 Tax=uncultured Gimesia sp. TaxID=1678688 RepID=UPI0030D70C76|tara:strand:- start:30128 stop:31015 length:888 start_codon:yes stop_codon:yes gene_type:complete
MTDSQNKIELKNPVIAAILAFLIPGAGHFYQGRTFKAAIYCFCILSTFFCGMALGDWKTVYYQSQPGKRTLGYFAQVGVGLPAIPALVQTSRYNKLVSPSNLARNDVDSNYFESHPYRMEMPLEAPFKGTLLDRGDDGKNISGELEGYIKLKTVPSDFGTAITGTFEGTLDNKPISPLNLSDPVGIGLPLGGDKERALECAVVREVNGRETDTGHIEGSIPRPFLNWFEMPLSNRELDDINKKLGKRYEFAVVFTWIAGLLNLLVIWDAFEGPAYGRGDEEEATPQKKPVADPKP